MISWFLLVPAMFPFFFSHFFFQKGDCRGAKMDVAVWGLC